MLVLLFLINKAKITVHVFDAHNALKDLYVLPLFWLLISVQNRLHCFLHFQDLSCSVMCQICRSSHDSIDELNAHYESDHPTGGRKVQKNEEGRFPCEFGDKSFARKQHVYFHQRSVHGVESAGKRVIKARYQGSFPCEVCGKMLASKTRLKTHMKSKHNIGWISV